MGDWCTIESDPGVFTSLIESFGVTNVELTELWSLDDDSLSTILHDYNKVYGLIFLFKWQRESSSSNNSNNSNNKSDDDLVGVEGRKLLLEEEVPTDLFFAKQVTTNACATQAILSVLLNAPCVNEEEEDHEKKIENDGTSSSEDDIKLGPMLTNFKSFISSFPSDLKGEAIGANEEIRDAHNSFARKDAFLIDDQKKRVATDDDDVFHFIAYVPHRDGNVCELDGLQPGPISVGTTSSSSNDNDMEWLAVARSAIQSRIEQYAATEIKFNLMAIVRDRRSVLQSRIASLLAAGVEETDSAIVALNTELACEEEKRNSWNMENERRRFNYLPFCMQLLRELAASDNFSTLTDMAKKKTLTKRMKRQG